MNVVEYFYARVRNAIPVEAIYTEAGLPPLDFSQSSSVLFYETKKNGWFNAHYYEVEALKIAFNSLPHLKKDTTPIEKDFYTDLTGAKFYPKKYQKSLDPLDCFLKNAPALCTHNDNDNTAELDLQYLSSYPVSKGFERYGSKAFLDIKNGKYTLIKVENTPYAADSEKAKCIFLASFAIHVVFSRHAVMSHISVAQRILVKFLDSKQEDRVKNNPRLETLLQILTTRVNEVSINEQLLIGCNGLVDRVCSFDKGVIEQAGEDLHKEYSNMSPKELIALLADGSKQWKAAVTTGWQAALNLISALKLDLQDDENELLALDVWVSSFYHRFIGDFQLDNLMKGNLPFPCTGNKHEHTKDYAIQVTTIAATTMTRTYSVKDVPQLINDEVSKSAWTEYSLALDNLDTGILDFDGIAYASVNF